MVLQACKKLRYSCPKLSCVIPIIYGMQKKLKKIQEKTLKSSYKTQCIKKVLNFKTSNLCSVK